MTVIEHTAIRRTAIERTAMDLSGPSASFSCRRLGGYNLAFDGLKDLMIEEELLAYLATTEGLSAAAQHRLDAIAVELDRRWALFG